MSQAVTSQTLFACKQEPGEALQCYFRRLLNIRAQALGISDEVVIDAAINGLRIGQCAQYFARKPPKTVAGLHEKMNEFCWVDNDLRLRQQEQQRSKEMNQQFGKRNRANSSSDDQVRTQNVFSIEEEKSELRQEPKSFRGGHAYRGGRGGRNFGGRNNGGSPRTTYWSHVPITFDQSDLRLRDYPHNDAMVINCNIGDYVIHDVLVDNGSSADILMAKAFRQMNLGGLVLEPATNLLCGFWGRKVDALGKISLQVSFREISNPRTEFITFDVVDINDPYNAILGRGTLNAFEATVHSACLAMNIPAYKGIITVYGSQKGSQYRGRQTGSSRKSGDKGECRGCGVAKADCS
ncbi:hypothetical protein BS78_10G149900 [Paspalum vaginatum]|nr:hypothetical protein BS78_10G149900 [Paspalum vaginatum]